jgi:excisionase family DNA binding protein
MSDELLTAREAAAYLKLSLGAFYALRRRQHIPNAGHGKRLLFRRADLLRRETPPLVDMRELARRHARKPLSGSSLGESFERRTKGGAR